MMTDYSYSIFSPYSVCPLDAHVDHQHGLVTVFAIDKGIDLWFSPNIDGKVHLKNHLALICHSVENGCGKDAPGNLAHYMVENATMHAWSTSAGRSDIGSLDTYHEACEKFGK